MTAHPHDAVFKMAFEAPADAALLLRELLPAAVRDAIAWETLERDRGSFADVRFSDRHADLLFSARLRTGGETRVFLLLEHQSTGDPAMPQRVLSYQTRIWDRVRRKQRRGWLPPIVAALVSHVPGGWTDARSVQELLDPEVMAIPGLAEMVPHLSLISLDLAHRTDAELQAMALPAFQRLVLWALRDARDAERLLDNFDAWRYLIREAGLGRSGREALSVLVAYLFRVVEPASWPALHGKLRSLEPELEESVMMSMAEFVHEWGRQNGRVEGRREGREEGREVGQRELLRSLLVRKFGALDAADEARLQAASSEAVERYAGRLLTAGSLAEVFADAAAPGGDSPVDHR